MVKKPVIYTALPEGEISAIPSKNKHHNVLHIKVQKEAVM